MFTASNDPGNVDRVDPARLPSGMMSFLGHVNTWKCSTEADYGFGILSLKPVG